MIHQEGASDGSAERLEIVAQGDPDVGEARAEGIVEAVGFTADHQEGAVCFGAPVSRGLARGGGADKVVRLALEKGIIDVEVMEGHVEDAAHGGSDDFGAEKFGATADHGDGFDP